MLSHAIAATLIAIFITPSGIVVGADTAVRQRGTAVFEVVPAAKFASCGTRAYAGLTGMAVWGIVKGTSTSTFYAADVVRKTCDEEATKQPAPSQLVLTNRIAEALAQYIESTYPRELRAKLRDEDEMSLFVAAHDGSNAAVTVSLISVKTARAAPAHVGIDCLGLAGNTGPASALLRGQAPISPELSNRPEVVAVRACREGRGPITADQARAFFRLAVDVSLQYAADFPQFERGVVNWPIDFGFIDSTAGVTPINREVKSSP